jgi:hypothetical protein
VKFLGGIVCAFAIVMALSALRQHHDDAAGRWGAVGAAGLLVCRCPVFHGRRP